jgi:hypothetical protein
MEDIKSGKFCALVRRLTSYVRFRLAARHGKADHGYPSLDKLNGGLS